jgi:hypothetical protein
MIASICHKFSEAFWRDNNIVVFVRRLLNMCMYTSTMHVCIIFDADGQVDMHCPIEHIPRLRDIFPQLSSALAGAIDSCHYHYANSPSTTYDVYKVITQSEIPVYVIFADERLYMVIVGSLNLRYLVPPF